MLVPEIVPNVRDDTYVDQPHHGGRQRTVYSGRLHFGAPARRGTLINKMDFAGTLFLPDSYPYHAEHVGEATIIADFWIQAMHEYLFVPTATAGFANDPSRPGIVWVQLGLEVEGASGSILGYRVTVSAKSGTIAG